MSGKVSFRRWLQIGGHCRLCTLRRRSAIALAGEIVERILILSWSQPVPSLPGVRCHCFDFRDALR